MRERANFTGHSSLTGHADLGPVQITCDGQRFAVGVGQARKKTRRERRTLIMPKRKVVKVNDAIGRGPYIDARYIVENVEYLFEFDKNVEGLWILKKCPRVLGKELDIREAMLVSLEQTISTTVEKKIVEVDDDATRYGPWWRLLFKAYTNYVEFVVDVADYKSAEKAARSCARDLRLHGCAHKDMNLLRVKREKKKT